MPGWRETVDVIEAEIGDLHRTFGGSVNVRLKDRQRNPRYIAQLSEAMQFMSGVYAGRKSIEMLREAMSTSDFPVLFADIISRSVLANYNYWPVTWPSVAKRVTVRDFRDNKLFLPLLGADSILTKVPEGTNYPETDLTEQTPITFTVAKYGRKLAFTFEAMVNDDLDFLRDMPQRLAVGARRTEERIVTEQYVASTGPHGTLYTTALKNLVVTGNGSSTNNPPLSIAGLQDAFTVLGNQVDENGEPIMVESVTLVVPPALEVTARNILSATELRFGTIAPGATSGQQQELMTQNWMRNRVNLQVNPYLPLIDTTSGHTAWYLFGNPAVGRPAIIAAFLRGYEQPQVLIKEPNARTPGGGSVDPMNGDFETDSIQYRVRHIMGTSRIDGKATVASKGTGAA